MSCSKPLKLYAHQIKLSPKSNFNPERFTLNALKASNFHNTYFEVPCGRCLNCRVDKMNELTDRCEYEYIRYGCGSFVTFTFDDAHLSPYMFIDSRDGKLKATLSKKCLKDFLNRLNKLVHNYNKEHGLTPFCRPDYKYLCVGEYGENGQAFDRCHYHCLFFGLDFAMCERLFWRAWEFQGSIQVGAIKNGGIGYVVSYLDKQIYGQQAWLKYDYHHLQRPFQVHSLGLGSGLYLSQLKYIKSHNGCYRWHGKDKPVPIYYKNKYLIIEDRSAEALRKKYKKSVDNILNLYGVKITDFKHLQKFKLDKSLLLQKLREIKLVQNCKPILDDELILKQTNNIIFGKNRIPNIYDKYIVKIVDSAGIPYIEYKKYRKPFSKWTTKDFMKLHTSKNQYYDYLVSTYGLQHANKIYNIADVPF